MSLLGLVIFLVSITLSCATTGKTLTLEQREMAWYYFDQNEFEKAAPLYQVYLESLPEDEARDEVLYRLAVCLQGMGRWSEADRYLAECFYDFPQSAKASDARRRFGARQWCLEWGVFTSWNQANQKITAWAAWGLEVQRLPVRINGDLIYAVRSGGYDTFAAARSALDGIEHQSERPEIVPAAFKQGAPKQEARL